MAKFSMVQVSYSISILTRRHSVSDPDDLDLSGITPVETPIPNFQNDIEDEDDFGAGWVWHEVDPGSNCAMWCGDGKLLFHPKDGSPVEFFEALFDNSLMTDLVLETNIYSDQRQLGKFSGLFQC